MTSTKTSAEDTTVLGWPPIATAQTAALEARLQEATNLAHTSPDPAIRRAMVWQAFALALELTARDYGIREDRSAAP